MNRTLVVLLALNLISGCNAKDESDVSNEITKKPPQTVTCIIEGNEIKNCHVETYLGIQPANNMIEFVRAELKL